MRRASGKGRRNPSDLQVRGLDRSESLKFPTPYVSHPRGCPRPLVNRGTPVAPCRLKAQRKRVTRVGSPCSPGFPNIMSCLRSPITAKPRVTH